MKHDGAVPTVRPAFPKDAEAIAWIIRESYRLLPAAHIPYEMPIYHAHEHLRQMEDPATRWRILIEQGKPVAVSMWRVIPGMAHLHMLFVAGEYQGKGYGSLLLKDHQKEAKDEHSDTRLLTLHCLRDSHWAMRFYKRHGYTEYQTGDEGRFTDLYIWIDACRRHDNSWPLRADKALFYKRSV